MSQRDRFGFSAPNCYNDVDMLTVGIYGGGKVGTGCTESEYRQQFVLWCMYGAPLMLGCDIRSMNEATRKLVTNPALIAIDQDEAARPPVWQRHKWNEISLRVPAPLEGLCARVLQLRRLRHEDDLLFRRRRNYGCRQPPQCETSSIFTGECAGEFRDFAETQVPRHDVKLFYVELVK